MRGSGNVILRDGNRLKVDYTVNEQRRHLPTGSGTWLASTKSLPAVSSRFRLPARSPIHWSCQMGNVSGSIRMELL